MEDSEVIMYRDGTLIFRGKDAIRLRRAAELRSLLLLFKRGLRSQRMSGTQALAIAARITGKKYKRGQYDLARTDLHHWITTMAAALPIEIKD
jgi:hypothetical protein